MILRILGRLKKSHEGFARKSDGGCKIGRMMRQVSGDFRIFLGILGRLKRSREDCGWKK